MGFSFLNSPSKITFVFEEHAIPGDTALQAVVPLFANVKRRKRKDKLITDVLRMHSVIHLGWKEFMKRLSSTNVYCHITVTLF